MTGHVEKGMTAFRYGKRPERVACSQRHEAVSCLVHRRKYTFSGVLSQGVHSSDITVIEIRCISRRTPFQGDFRSKCPIFIIRALLTKSWIHSQAYICILEWINHDWMSARSKQPSMRITGPTSYAHRHFLRHTFIICKMYEVQH